MEKNIKTKLALLTFAGCGLVVTAGMLSPIKALGAEETRQFVPTIEEYNELVQNSPEYKEKQDKLAILAAMPEPRTENKTYYKDGTDHEALTDDYRKELYMWVTNMEMNGEKVFPNVTPEILEAQQCHESSFIIDATNGDNGKGSCVGLGQCSCIYNIENVKKWCWVVEENPENIETSDDAREMLLKHPEINTLVEAQLLQNSYSHCPAQYADNPMKYALAIYRWGNMDDAQVEYNGQNNYCDSILSHAGALKAEYDAIKEDLSKESTLVAEKVSHPVVFGSESYMWEYGAGRIEKNIKAAVLDENEIELI